MTKNEVSIIGLGPMGQAITRVLLKNGYTVTVWNRTESKADKMEGLGALKAKTIAEVIGPNKLVILSLTDYDVMYGLLNTRIESLTGCTIINLSSDTPQRAQEAEKWALHHGANFLTGAIMVEPQTLGDSDALVFFSGNESVFHVSEPVLKCLGKCDYKGSDPGLAQLYSIALLNILFTNAVAVLQSIALIKTAGIQPTSFEPYLNNFLAVLPDMMEGTCQEVETGHYSGQMNNMNMMSAAMGHVAKAFKDTQMNTSVIEQVNSIFQNTVSLGYGGQGLSSIIEAIERK